jgi:hypothetical protein
MSLPLCAKCRTRPSLGDLHELSPGYHLCSQCLSAVPVLTLRPVTRRDMPVGMGTRPHTTVQQDLQAATRYARDRYVQPAEPQYEHTFSAQAVRGYRSWQVSMKTGWISGLFHRDNVWMHGPIVEADCVVHPHHPRNPMPSPEGPCGLWAFHSPRRSYFYGIPDMPMTTLDPAIVVPGVVEGGGHTIWHQKGWRAQKTRIVAVTIDPEFGPKACQVVTEAFTRTHPHVKIYDDYVAMIRDYPPPDSDDPGESELWDDPTIVTPGSWKRTGAFRTRAEPYMRRMREGIESADTEPALSPMEFCLTLRGRSGKVHGLPQMTLSAGGAGFLPPVWPMQPKTRRERIVHSALSWVLMALDAMVMLLAMFAGPERPPVKHLSPSRWQRAILWWLGYVSVIVGGYLLTSPLINLLHGEWLVAATIGTASLWGYLAIRFNYRISALARKLWRQHRKEQTHG